MCTFYSGPKELTERNVQENHLLINGQNDVHIEAWLIVMPSIPKICDKLLPNLLRPGVSCARPSAGTSLVQMMSYVFHSANTYTNADLL